MATSRKIGNPNLDKKNSLPSRKVCFFCENGREPSYTDSASLRKYLSDRSRIIGKQRSGVCSKHQRSLSLEIKHARHLALLPFITAVS